MALSCVCGSVFVSTSAKSAPVAITRAIDEIGNRRIIQRVEHLRCRGPAAGKRLLAGHALIDQVEGECGGLVQQVLQPFGIDGAQHLHRDTVVAVGANSEILLAETGDAAGDDIERAGLRSNRIGIDRLVGDLQRQLAVIALLERDIG